MNDRPWRTWLRSQRLWLLGCAMLAPVTIAWPIWNAWQDYAPHRPILATEVPATQAISFGGAEWRLGSVEILDPKGLRLASPVPPGTVFLVAHLSMTPQPGADSKLLASCTGRISDDQGRWWRTSWAALNLGEPVNCVASLRDGRIASLPAGETWRFAQVYLVPEDVAATARPELILPALQPRYLRFLRR